MKYLFIIIICFIVGYYAGSVVAGPIITNSNGSVTTSFCHYDEDHHIQTCFNTTSNNDGTNSQDTSIQHNVRNK